MPQRMHSLSFFVGLLAIAGCGQGPAALVPPHIARGAASAAMEKYDANHDGAISGEELAKAPALKATLKRLDTSGDGKVTPDEIDARIAAWQKSGIALTRTQASVRMNGQPLADAQVTLVPESFLGENIQPASGRTDANGNTFLSVPNPKPGEAGVHLGYYRIEVSKKKPDGSESIPAKFNTDTELGTEITTEDMTAERISVNLNTK